MNLIETNWYGFGFICGVLLGIGLTRKYYRETLKGERNV